MTSYRAPVEHSFFALHAVLPEIRFGHYPDNDVLESIFYEAGRFSAEVLHPLNRTGDIEGCQLHRDGRVVTPTGFSRAYAEFIRGGWSTLAGAKTYGGQAFASTISAAIQEYWISANMGFAQYNILTQSAIATLNAAGSPEQKAKYLPKLISGEWTGAMSLTEPHCGSDLGLIRAKAFRQNDGSFEVTGTKVFISAGDQDLTDNIVHLVLARIEGAPLGVGGLSLFIVPKMLTDEAGRSVCGNGIVCSSLEHKMGLRASATCILNFERSAGFLVGLENRGLANMFLMMNETRLTTGLQGVAMAEVAYQNALSYARERRQGRSPTGASDPLAEADPILVHPDVRRMLMDMKAFIESARALVFWTASLADQKHMASDVAERHKAGDLVGLMTPIVKAYLTDICLARTIDAQQIYGGCGYVSDYGMEQFVRDARISQIYEGTNGIQAMDLVGRKVSKDRGEALAAYVANVRADIDLMSEGAEADALRAKLNLSIVDLERSADCLLRPQTSATDLASAGHDFLHLVGTVALGHMWTKLVRAAQKGMTSPSADMTYFNTRLLIARYFADRWLPETAARRARIESGSASTMALSSSDF